MEVRPYLTAGAAIVTTGALVVAMPAIVPAPTPPDVSISATAPRSVYADVELTQFTTQALLNAIFSGFPDTNGPAGAVGVAAFLTQDIPLVTDFVNGGVVGLATALFGADPVAAAFLDGGIVGVAALLTEDVPLAGSFFGGFSEDGPIGIVGVLDELTAGNDLANAFVLGGIVGLASELTDGVPLVNSFFAGGPNGTPGGIVGVLDELTQNDAISNAFVTGGSVSLTEELLVQAAGDDEVLATGIQSFFSGYPLAGPDDDPPAGPAGIVGLVHFILDGLTGGVQTEPGGGTGTDEDGAGVEGAGDTLMLASGAPEAQGAEGAQTFSLQQFGAAARSGLPAANEPLEPSENGITVSTTDLESDPVDPTTVETTEPVGLDPVDTTEPVETTEPDPTVTPVGSTTPGSGSGSLPVVQLPVAPSTPPTTEPVVDPVVDPEVDPVVNEEEKGGGDADDPTDLKDGNKFTPEPIIPFGTRGGGPKDPFQGWKDLANKLGLGGGGAAPASPNTGAPAGGEGNEDGS